MAMICFDLDNVLADFDVGFLAFLNDKMGTHVKISEVKSYSFTKVIPGLTPELFRKYFMEFTYQGGLLKLNFMRQHYEMALRAMIAEGHQICYITSRPPEAKNDTIKWLAKKGLPMSHLVVTHDKVSAAKRLDVDIVVEDNVDNIKALMNANIPCIMVSRPHNLGQNVEGVARVNTSGQLLSELHKLL